MSANELPKSGNWSAVHDVISRRMDQLEMPVARLSRESGVSETTIRYIGQPGKRQRSTLVALGAALGFAYDYLVDVLGNRAMDDGTGVTPGMHAILAEVQNIGNRILVKLDRL